ncbi:PIN domain-containing protein [Candidatus Woesearchaeota archaeon]|nr:PIN domain-containing protein [Candidatus Woesearchaeota archaeon]
MVYIIDSYAWIEYFIGSSKGSVLKKLFLAQENTFLTLSCCLGEIKGWTLREQRNFTGLFTIIRANSTIIPLSDDDWMIAADIRFEQRKKQKDFGFIDAVILAKQQELSCKVISGDVHFRGLKDVIFLE